MSQKLWVFKKNLILMHQTYSNKVIEIKKNNYEKKFFGCSLPNNGFALGVTADCVPILVYDKNKIIG